MPEWGAALICLAIVIVAVLITSLIKLILKKVAKSNGEDIDCDKLEYLFAAISFILSAVGVFWFLRFGLGVTDVNVLVKNTGLYAGCAQAVYLFIVQLIRKGGKGLLEKIKNIWAKLKGSENPIQELPAIIEEETKTETTTETTAETPVSSETTDDDGVTKLKNEFAKIIKK